MANYKQQDIEGAQVYQRSKQIVIDNPLAGHGVPSVAFLEEKVCLLDNELAFREDVGEIYKVISDFYELYPILDITTDIPLGADMSYGQMYVLLYSAYRYLGAIRDYPIPILRIYAHSADKNESETNFVFKVIRWGALDEQATVDWIVGGTGDHPADAADFGGTFPSGTLTFAVGEYFKTITVQVSNDTDVESDETFAVTLSNPEFATIDIAEAIGTIRNEDA